MNHKIIILFLILIFSFSCSKKEVETNIPTSKDKAFQIYQEAVIAMDNGEYFFASKKFKEAEEIMPKIEFAAKSSIMASYCLYLINFYDEANLYLERFVKRYPVDKNVSYAYYLLALNSYEQILDEKKDVTPLIDSKKKIKIFIKKYPDTEYALDLKFKLDLINNQIAAKELYVAKYYMNNKKWIPAINRLKLIVNDYNETIFIEEALHRLVEVYYEVGLNDEANAAAVLLGYNYNSSTWYEQSYKIINSDYKIKKPKNKKSNSFGLIKRTIKKILN
jgi:outer membrane protein assembly factor BamD